MSEIVTTKALNELIQEQGEALLNYVALIAAGQTDVEIDIPEGIEVMSDLAVALQYLAEDVGDRIKSQTTLLNELESRVQERTKELEETLENLRRSQQQFVREEWSRYLRAQSENQENPDWMQNGPFEPVVQKAVQEKAPAFSPAKDNQASALTLPINYADELIGLLGFEGDDLENITDDDLAALEDIAEQVGLALENQRLFDLTQLALSETEELYRVSSLLNSAETPKDVTEAIVGPLAGENPVMARLWIISEDEENQQWFEMAHDWSADPDAPHLAPGFRMPLSRFPFLENLLNNERETTLISSVKNDPRTRNDTEFVSILANRGIESLALLPLTIGTRLIGLFNIGWSTVRSFNDTDLRRFSSIAAQTGTSVDSLRSFEETKLRAERLEALSDIEAALSFASNENELVKALSQEFESARIAINYIDSDENEQPVYYRTMASYENGEFLSPEYLKHPTDINTFPVSDIWLNAPNRITSTFDIQADDRASAETKKLAEVMGYQAAAILPLRSGRTWQGALVVSWKDKHRLTQTETFLLEQLREPLGAIVASIRAQFAEEQARQESEQLYNASRSLNESANSLDSIMTITTRLGASIGMETSALLMVQSDRLGNPVGLQLAALHKTAEAENYVPIDHKFGRASLEQISEFVDPVFFDDLKVKDQSAPALTTGTKRLLETFSARSAAILPLRSGEKEIGYLLLLSGNPAQFTAEIKRLFNSLSPQIAVAVQNSQLLEAAQKKAEREEMLRQITEKVRNTSDVESVMRTAVTEIGRVLNRKTFLYLKDTSEDTGEHFRPEQK